MKMNQKLTNLCVGFGVLTLAAAAVAQQTPEVKAKPPLYTYVANFAIPRAEFAEWDKDMAADTKTMEAALAYGTVVAFGEDKVLVHTSVGFTHDDWWCSTSMPGLLTVLDQLSKSSEKSPVLGSSTKHADDIFVSHFYNWKSGKTTNGYIHSATYMVKPDAPAGTVDTLSKSMIVPLLEKLLADGSISAYQVATQAIHTEDPGMFFVFYVAPKADGLDKVTAALTVLQSNSIQMGAFYAATDTSAHRDGLTLGNSEFK
jgi:hypothetical protein